MKSDEIRAIRLQNKITVEEFAKMICCHPETVRRWESNYNRISKDSIEKIKQVFNGDDMPRMRSKKEQISTETKELINKIKKNIENVKVFDYRDQEFVDCVFSNTPGRTYPFRIHLNNGVYANKVSGERKEVQQVIDKVKELIS